MPTITVDASLGPSPRKAFLRDWHIAQAADQMAFIAANITDDVTLQIMGQTRFKNTKAHTLAMYVIRSR